MYILFIDFLVKFPFFLSTIILYSYLYFSTKRNKIETTTTNNLERHISNISSIISTDVMDALKQTATEQEELASKEITLRELQFWHPQNILSVEDTPFSNRYLVTLLVISFSVPGNLARISLQELCKYDDSYINYQAGTIVWVNFAACFVMSWANNAVKFWNCILENSDKKNMKQIALHSGITAGFCGTFSSFSSMMVEIFFKTINNVESPVKLPNNGYKVMEFFAILLTNMAVSFFGHSLGKNFAVLFDYLIVPRIKRVLSYQNCRILELTLAILGILALIANLVLSCALSVNYWFKLTYSLAILMGAVGTFTRFKLSQLNGRIFAKWFPAGTLAANLLGCLLMAIVQLLAHGYKNMKLGELLVPNKVHQFVLNSFSLGFAGSLTTISSFINELYNLDYPLYQHIYFWSTFIPSLIIFILIDGTYSWTKGIQLL